MVQYQHYSYGPIRLVGRTLRGGAADHRRGDQPPGGRVEAALAADIGGAAVVEAVAVGVPEHEVALHSTATMVREIARVWPHAELMDTWTWFQSGINTDGAHNPVTSRRIERGDILSLNCFPMVAGYYVALERTLFAEHASDEHLRLWEINCKVHDRGKELLVSGNSCADIAKELNAMYAEKNLLLIKGGIPGSNGSLVTVRHAVKAKVKKA